MIIIYLESISVPGYLCLVPGLDISIPYSFKTLGKGATARTIEGELLNSELVEKHKTHKIAIKIVSVPDAGDSKGSSSHFYYEIALMNGLPRCPWIVDFVGYTDEPIKCIVMKFYKMNLKTFLASIEMNRSLVYKVATDVARGIEVMHKSGVVHFDLKPGNI